MQSTLLGIAIAIIVAFATALIAPFFIDFGRYRAEFEAEASRLTGLDVHIAGPIDARLLPAPRLTMQDVRIGKGGDAGTIEAHRFAMELSLTSLVRGEWRVSDVHLDGADVRIGLDAAGRLDWPAPAGGQVPATLSVDALDIAHSRVVLADAASGARLVLDNFEFTGEARALTGPIRGEGAFMLGGERYPYTIAATSADDAVRVHLTLAPRDRSFTADADGAVTIARGRPRFDGALQIGRPAERAAEGRPAIFSDRWRLSARINGDSGAATLEQLEVEYGHDERAAKLRGDAKLAFGAQPRLDATLAAPQLDLDRVLALPDQSRRPIALTTLLAGLVAGSAPPLAVKLGLNVEGLTVAGTTLQRVAGEVRNDGDGWVVRSLEFRGPGASQVQLGGRLDATPTGAAFAGPAKIDSPNPRALLAWLTGRTDTDTIAGPFRAEGDIRLGGGAVSVERLAAEVGRLAVKGRFAYAWPSGTRPARLDAVLNAPEFDLDRVRALAQGVLGDTPFEWPREGTLALNLGKATVGGIEAERIEVNTQFGEQTLDVDRLAVGDLGGLSVVASGRIDTRTLAPRGALTVDLEARGIDGMIAFLDGLAPSAAATLRRLSGQLVPAKLSLAMRSGTDAAGSPTRPTLKVDGTAGALTVSLAATADANGTTLADLAKIGSADITGNLDAADGRALVAMIGLDRLVSVDNRAGQLTFKSAAAADGATLVDVRLVAGGLDAAAKGPVQLAAGSASDVALSIAAANFRSVGVDETVPVALAGRFSVADGTATLNDLAGTVAGSDVKGRLSLAPGMRLGGELTVNTLDLPAVLGAVIGMPARKTAGWSPDPFVAPRREAFTGEIAVTAATAVLSPKLAAANLRTRVTLGPSGLTFDDLDGALGGGHLSGMMALRRGAEDVEARGHIRLDDADAAPLMPGDGRAAVEGRLTLDADVAGAGRSPQALFGSLKGFGKITIANARLARLDPAAFDAAIRSADGGTPIEMPRVRDRVEQVLNGGSLAVARAEGAIAVNAGRVRLSTASAQGVGADPDFIAGIDLERGVIDARLTLTAATPAGNRPQIVVNFNGPIEAPKRTVDVAAFTNWLSLRASEREAARLEALKAARTEPPANPPANPPAAPKPDVAGQPPASPQPKRPEPTPPAKPDVAALPPPKAVEEPPRVEPERSPAVNPDIAAKPTPPTQPAKPPDEAGSPKPAAPAELPAAPASPDVAALPPTKPAEPPAEPKSDDPAIQALDRAIEANPNDATALYRRGQLLAGKSSFARAVTDFDAVIRLEPRNAEAFNNRCWARAILGDPETALKDCNEALRIRPRFVDALDSRGFVNLKMGQTRSAIEDYDLALKGNPKQASSLYGRGIARMRTGSTAEGMSDIAAAKALQADIAEEFAGYGIR